MAGAPIELKGMREFRTALKRMDANLPKLLRVALNEASAVVIDYASSRFPRKSGRAAQSLKARSSQQEARVALGGRRAPYAPWLVYGGQGRIAGRPAPRLFIRKGRDFGPYAALDHRSERITQIMSDGLAQIGRDAGLEMT